MKTQGSISTGLTAWLAFPLVLASAAGLYGVLGVMQAPHWVSVYLPVVLAALCVTALERVMPERAGWRPDAREIKESAVVMALVQGLLPKALALAAVLGLSGSLANAAPDVAQVWPHEWPVIVQAALMLLLADLLRYWLHRASHALPWLWRLHAVHHAPRKLFWLSVGRFHPLEKALQFVLDALPFLLLGVAPEVIGLYFVVYATIGFFQHSNTRLRFGALNYVFSTAELHRWHHAVDPRVGHCNFGNNLALWDIVFGTFYRPVDASVGEVGIGDDSYPERYIEQLRNRRVSVSADWRGRLRAWLIGAALWIVSGRRVRSFERALGSPRETQLAALKRILRANRDTGFGRAHGFGGIRTVAQFRERVPVQQWDDVQPWVSEDALTNDEPCFYARTSGTTGDPKDLPITRETLQQMRAQQRLFSYFQHRACPEAFSGKALVLAGSAREGVGQGGVPYGSMSGWLYASAPAMVRRASVVPPEVFDIEDCDVRDHVIVRLALQETHITWLGAANPSSFVRLAEVLERNAGSLCESLRRGYDDIVERLAPRVRAAVAPRLRKDPVRAQAIRRLAASGELAFSRLWPSLKLLTTWTGGSCGIALDSLRRMLPRETRVMELGFVATELRATVADNLESSACVPLLQDHFFEFVERDLWDRGEPEFKLLHELAVGVEYYLIVTTPAGLSRYFMNDLVEVSGFAGSTPRLRFLRKGRGVTNITGEKLTETQLIQAMATTCERTGAGAGFYAARAHEHDRRYQVFVEFGGGCRFLPEHFAPMLDAALCALNVEYASKRKGGRLGMPLVRALTEGTAHAFRRFGVRGGQRDSQFKPLILDYVRDDGFAFEDHVLDAAPLAEAA